jgi:hypothetical protein
MQRPAFSEGAVLAVVVLAVNIICTSLLWGEINDMNMEIVHLRKMIETEIGNLTEDIKGLRKMTETNMTEIKEEIKGLRKMTETNGGGIRNLYQRMEAVRTKLNDLQNLFVSAQKGQSAVAFSALSIHENGHRFACGTLVYSARLKEAIVITNRHAVANSAYHCSYEINHSVLWCLT